jgi:SAM-dependent methyltransferase
VEPHAHEPVGSQEFFDARAATWDDDPAKVERAEVVARAIRDAVPLDGSTRVLEYGAGTGLVTQALRDAVGPVTLADTSAGMREVIDSKIASGAIGDARVWDVDLAEQDAPAGEEFDLIVTVMTLHHIPDLTRVLANFATLLRAGGHLCIADLEGEDGSFQGEGFAGHHGFDRAELEADLVRAGFADVSIARCHEVVRDDGTYPLFLATCVRRV